jgi:uncharacterized membrane protein
MRVAVFFALFLGCSVLGLVIGDRPERRAAATVLLGGFLSIAAMSASMAPWRGVEPLLAAVDLAMLVAFVLIAMHSQRFWTLLVAGLQGTIVGGHLLRMIHPDLPSWQYWLSSAIWSWPIVILIGIAAVRHRRPKTMRPTLS